MNLLTEFMEVYRHAFHPLVVLVGCSLLLVYDAWSANPDPSGSLRTRIATALGIEALAVAPVPLYLFVTGRSVASLTLGNDWRSDLLTGGSLFVASALLWYVWRAKDWGSEMRGASRTILVVTVPYVLLSLVWNVSGHVTFTLVPTLYLALVDRRYWPLLVIPVLMVANRPIVDMHTWSQSVAGFALGTAGVLATYSPGDRARDRSEESSAETRA